LIRNKTKAAKGGFSLFRPNAWVPGAAIEAVRNLGRKARIQFLASVTAKIKGGRPVFFLDNYRGFQYRPFPIAIKRKK
jgi:hypothetical protein